LAFRVLGTGSVGLRSYVALLHGNENDPAAIPGIALLTAGEVFEPVFGGRGQSVAAQYRRRRAPFQAAPVALAASEDVQQGTADPLGVLMRLREQAGHDPGTEPADPAVRDGLVGPPSSRRKWLLPEPFAPSTPKNTSVSKAAIRPVSSSDSQVTARMAVRPSRRRGATFCAMGCNGGAPASSNLHSSGL
jgi:hypothetical protein